MKANGSENTSSLYHLSVNEILKNKFNVGTEKAKKFTHQEPKDEDLIPLRFMDITSDNKKAKEKLNPLQVEGNSLSDEEDYDASPINKNVSEDEEDCVVTSSGSDRVEIVAKDSDDNASSGADSDIRLVERDAAIDFDAGAEDGVMNEDGDKDGDGVGDSNATCMVEGETDLICGKAICLLCSESSGISEEERRTRCPLRASNRQQPKRNENIVQQKRNVNKPNNKMKIKIKGKVTLSLKTKGKLALSFLIHLFLTTKNLFQ